MKYTIVTLLLMTSNCHNVRLRRMERAWSSEVHIVHRRNSLRQGFCPGLRSIVQPSHGLNATLGDHARFHPAHRNGCDSRLMSKRVTMVYFISFSSAQ